MILLPVAREGGYESDSSLVVRFMEKKLEVMVSGGGYIGSESPKITLRWDAKPAQDLTWESSNTGDAAFAPHPCEFLQQMVKSKTLAIRVHEFRAPTTLVFDVSRSNEAVDKFPALKAAAAKGLKAENIATAKAAAERSRFIADTEKTLRESEAFLKRARAK